MFRAGCVTLPVEHVAIRLAPLTGLNHYDGVGRASHAGREGRITVPHVA